MHVKSDLAFYTLSTEPVNITYIPGNFTVLPGQGLNITCEATGRPVPRVMWLKDSKEISKGSGRTQFVKDEFTITDAGVYTCVAGNNFTTDTKHVYVSLDVSGDVSALKLACNTSIRFYQMKVGLVRLSKEREERFS